MTEYKRDLGLKESVAIVISRIIGSGIFRTQLPLWLWSAALPCLDSFGLLAESLQSSARLFMQNSRL